MRGTGGSTVPTLFLLCYTMPLRGWGSLVKPVIMKKLFLLPIFALALCVTSCGDDDFEQNQPENPSVSDTKKLVSMEYEHTASSSYQGWSKIEFEYDAMGNVVSYTQEGGDDDDYGAEVVDVDWNEDGFSLTIDDNRYWQCKVVNGKIVSQENNSFKELFIYDSSGYLKAVKSILSDGSEERTEYRWSNGMLLRDGRVEYKYSGKTCAGYFPLFYSSFDYLFCAAPQLLGTVSNCLPDMQGIYGQWIEFGSYEFYDDGYLKSFVESGFVNGEKAELKYKFKWQ